ncbi:GNAT family N-acetyltransferase [Bacillus sp. Bva_UNVM-123]|uniref:GNAT family N-acetyltransferase n=1 Tax=Bacillus sp. Bva_UNVM-123 TaxID=2829798 RepID=UPI00391F3243
MIDVRTIKPEMTYSLRHSVLRPHQTIDDCKYETDHEDGAFHIGAFYEGKLISIASFCLERNPDFPDDKQYRLRGMATLEDYRKLGAGRAIVAYFESLIKDKEVHLIWCKARTTVQAYYNKLGFIEQGEVFDYPPIGPHIVMYKKLT